MVPFYDNKEDKEMVHLLHYLKNLVDVEDVRPTLEKTFNLPHLRDPAVLEKVDGVIEQICEDISDEDLLFLESSSRNTETRKTLAEPTAEDIPTEGVKEQNIGALMRTMPKTKPSNIKLLNGLPKYEVETKSDTPVSKLEDECEGEEEEFEVIETEVYEEEY